MNSANEDYDRLGRVTHRLGRITHVVEAMNTHLETAKTILHNGLRNDAPSQSEIQLWIDDMHKDMDRIDRQMVPGDGPADGAPVKAGATLVEVGHPPAKRHAGSRSVQAAGIAAPADDANPTAAARATMKFCGAS